MPEVWVIETHQYDGSRIEGVATNREEAELWVAVIRKREDDSNRRQQEFCDGRGLRSIQWWPLKEESEERDDNEIVIARDPGDSIRAIRFPVGPPPEALRIPEEDVNG